jgi:hypothetical protein
MLRKGDTTMIDGLDGLFAVSPGGSGPAEDTETPEASTDPVEPSAEWKARRRRALGYRRRLPYQGQTGPRSTRGKRRASLNRVTRFLVPFWVAKDLRAQGENPQEFRRLHRDLIGWLGPDDARGRVLVEELAEEWWEKIRRLRNWVGAGECDCREINARIDETLRRFVWAERLDHRKWRYRLESALGSGLYAPQVLRERIEARVPLLGGKPPNLTKSSRRLQPPDPEQESQEALARLQILLSVMFPGRSQEPEATSQRGAGTEG